MLYLNLACQVHFQVMIQHMHHLASNHYAILLFIYLYQSAYSSAHVQIRWQTW